MNAISDCVAKRTRGVGVGMASALVRHHLLLRNTDNELPMPPNGGTQAASTSAFAPVPLAREKPHWQSQWHPNMDHSHAASMSALRRRRGGNW